MTASTAAAVVLVIDDQPVNVRLLEALLSSEGYRVLSATDGQHGLELAAHGMPDVVLLDMRMPHMDGFGVLDRLRAAPSTRELPVIFLTSDDDRENLIRAFAAGVTDYITKPFVSRELMARVRTHVDLKRSRDALQRFAEEKQEMAELVAHDLRNYLANIMFATDLQCATPGADPRLVRLAHSIRSSADAGLLFLDALLDQQEQQARGGGIEPLPVRQMVCEAVDLLSRSALAKEIAIEQVPHDTLVMSGLRSGVASVLQNMLSNAIKYSPRGSAVEVLAGEHKGHVRLQVRDRGPGIAEDERDRLFQRFVRLSSEPTEGEKATGLGLAMAKQQARTMGGNLWFEPRTGGGSIFTLELPLA